MACLFSEHHHLVRNPVKVFLWFKSSKNSVKSFFKREGTLVQLFIRPRCSCTGQCLLADVFLSLILFPVTVISLY